MSATGANGSFFLWVPRPDRGNAAFSVLLVSCAQSWPKEVDTLLGPKLGHTADSLRFQGSNKPYSTASVILKDMQKADKSGKSKTISVQGINGLLLPANLTSLIPVKDLAEYTYGVDPPAPKVKISESGAPFVARDVGRRDMA